MMPSRQRWFRWHAWLGLTLGLMLFAIVLTGTVAVFSHEIDWLGDEALRVTTRDAEYDWQAVFEGVRAAHPDKEVSYILAPRHPGFAARVLVRPVAGEYLNVYADPYTGEVTGTRHYWNVQRFFRSLHRRFFVPNPFGLLLVTIVGGFLLVSLVSGLIASRPWWRHGLRVRRGRGVRVWLGDLHRGAGYLSLLFGIVITVFGIWYLVELIRPPDRADWRSLEVPQQEGRPRDLDALVGAAAERFDRFQLSRIGLSARDAPVMVAGKTTSLPVRAEASGAALDPFTGEILALRTVGDAGPYALLGHLADPLHFGTWGGLASQALWFVAGLLMSAGILLGTAIWARRHEGRMLPRGPRRQGRVGFATAAVVFVAAGCYGVVEYRYWSHAEAPATSASDWTGGEGSGARLFATDGDGDARPDRFVVQYSPDWSGRPAALSLRTERGEIDLGMRWVGMTRQEASLPESLRPEDLAGASVRLTGVDRGGGRAMLEELEPAPASSPSVRAYVWIVIGGFLLLFLLCVLFWTRLLFPARIDENSAAGRVAT